MNTKKKGSKTSTLIKDTAKDETNLSRRDFLYRLGVGATVLGLSSNRVIGNPIFNSLLSKVPSQTTKPPNIIVILTDDLGWGDLSCYPQVSEIPDTVTHTPNIDRMAAEGVQCMQAYATCMVCSPSRAGLITGRYQQYFGWYEFKEDLAGIPKNEFTIAEYLKSKRYATGIMGKWHLGYKPELGPLHHGFDRFYGFLGGQHDYFDPGLGDPTVGFSFDHDEYILDQETPVKEMDYLTDELTKRSIQFIDKHAQAKQPFFLYLAYSVPHPPEQSVWDKLEPYAQLKKNGKFSERDIVRGMIDSLDEDVGKIMKRLKDLGIDENTLVIFTSDNGGADDRGEGQSVVQHNGGLRPRKGFYWEGGIRIPMILRWPGHIPAGKIYDPPVSHLDIFATAVAVTQTGKAPKPLDGVNLIPYLTGKKQENPHEILYWGQEKQWNRWAIRKGKWKLTSDVVSPKSQYENKNTIVMELHDLETDPEERVDFKDRYPEIVKELTSLMDDFYKKCKTTIATPDLMKAWQKDLEELKQKVPNANQLRHDGAPGHWL